MNELLQERIRKVVEIYSGHFYWRNCTKQSTLDFWEFLSGLKGRRYADFSQQLSIAARESGYLESELVLRAMTDQQKGQLGAKFQDSLGRSFLEYQRKQHDQLDKIILGSLEAQEFRRTVQPYLGDTEVNRRTLKRLAETLYQRLSAEDKKDIAQKQILIRLLNLGFLKIPRVSHRAACDFIVKYPSLFRNEGEVIDSLVERLVDEELATTPIDRTAERVSELKDYARRLYGVIQ